MMNNVASETTMHLQDALRTCDTMLGALIRSRSYEQAKVVFWEMHALSLRLQAEQNNAVAAER